MADKSAAANPSPPHPGQPARSSGCRKAAVITKWKYLLPAAAAAAAVSGEQGRAGSEVWLRATDKRLCLYCGRRAEALIRFLQLGEASEDKKRSPVVQKGRRCSSSAATTAGSLKEKIKTQTGLLGKKLKRCVCKQSATEPMNQSVRLHADRIWSKLIIGFSHPIRDLTCSLFTCSGEF